MIRPERVTEFEWATWRRWLGTLSPDARAAYEVRWQNLTDDERVAAVEWGGRKLRALAGS